MKRLLIAICLVLLASPAWAVPTTYYVRNDGNDTVCLGTTNAAYAVGVTACGFKTIAKINSGTPALAGDDLVKFKDDHIWYETITPPASGTSGHQITYTRTSDGTNKPKIYGSENLGAWDQTDIPYGDTKTFGNTGEPASVAPYQVNQASCAKFTLSEAANVTSMTFYSAADAGVYAKGFILDDDGGSGEPGTILGVTNATAPGTTVGHVQFNFAAPVSLTAGDYWLCQVSSGTAHNIRYATASGVAYRYWTAYVSYASPGNWDPASDTALANTTLGVYATYGGPLALPADTWKVACSTLPSEVWFVALSTGVHTLGKKETVLANVNAEYDWYYDPTGYLVVYAATNPGTRYASVQATVRSATVANGTRNYITVNGLELAYANDQAVNTYQQTYWVVDGNLMHHIGTRNEATAESVSVRNSNITVSNNVIHNIGNHGITITADNTQTIASVVIDGNTLYDNYHSDIDLQNPNGTFTSAIIRNNLLYNTADFDSATYSSGGIYVLGNIGNAINGVQIYNNVIHDKAGTSIVIRDKIVSPVIYNNTIYGALSGSAQTGLGIDVFSLGTYFPSGVIVKNNIGVDTHDQVFKCDNSSNVDSVENNLWYQSAGGTATYTKVNGTSYHYDDQAAYQAATGWDDTGGWSDPTFVSATNYHLKPKSPAIGAGVNVSLTTDYAGRRWRGTPSMGAYEYVPKTVCARGRCMTMSGKGG